VRHDVREGDGVVEAPEEDLEGPRATSAGTRTVRPPRRQWASPSSIVNKHRYEAAGGTPAGGLLVYAVAPRADTSAV